MARSRTRRRPIGWRSVAVILALVAVFALLRGLSTVPAEPEASGYYTDKLVLVGDTDHYRLSDTDTKIISARPDSIQAAAFSARGRYLDECAASGWSTIGAGRRAGVEGLCQPSVNGTGDSARVADWDARVRAAAAEGGDAHLGTLASLTDRCISAVGPGAALAAADRDGRLDNYLTPQQFADGGYRVDCPLTIVDASGADADMIISRLAERDDITLIVAGVGHDPTASVPDPRSLQVIYRVGTTFPGLMTSAGTQREGIVTNTDLSRTLAAFLLQDKPLPPGTPIDGSPITVLNQPVSAQLISNHLRAVDNLSDVAPIGYVAGTLLAVVLVALVTIFTLRRQWTVVQVGLAALGTLMATLMLTGAFPWASEDRPAAALIFALLFWAVALTVITLIVTAVLKIPVTVAAAGVTMAAFSTDAALGAVMQPGSLLNSQPEAGLRWYGFGNATFGSYAAAGLVVAGYLAHRFRRSGHRWSAPIAVLAVGALLICCQGWPSMGADFGGVISLTPTVLFLALAVSGLRITWPRLVIIAVAAVVAVGTVSVIDWTRGPGARTHLGDFVQRVIAGDAGAIVLRKAIASAGTLISPVGIVGIILGVALWVIIFGWARHAVPEELYATFTVTAIAALATGIIGTLLNDAGISVFITVTGPFAVATAGLLFQRCRQHGWQDMITSMTAHRAGRAA